VDQIWISDIFFLILKIQNKSVYKPNQGSWEQDRAKSTKVQDLIEWPQVKGFVKLA